MTQLHKINKEQTAFTVSMILGNITTINTRGVGSDCSSSCRLDYTRIGSVMMSHMLES